MKTDNPRRNAAPISQNLPAVKNNLNVYLYKRTDGIVRFSPSVRSYAFSSKLKQANKVIALHCLFLFAQE